MNRGESSGARYPKALLTGSIKLLSSVACILYAGSSRTSTKWGKQQPHEPLVHH